MVRKTKQKEAILRVLKGTTSHPAADWVYEQVRREIPHISLGTVYRNLKLLKQEGKVLELGFAGTLSRFDGNTQYHYHFICEQCGRVFDVSNDKRMERAMLGRIARETGFRITLHRCELRGLCRDCQARDSLRGR